jgi:hypothetical protein
MPTACIPRPDPPHGPTTFPRSISAAHIAVFRRAQPPLLDAQMAGAARKKCRLLAAEDALVCTPIAAKDCRLPSPRASATDYSLLSIAAPSPSPNLSPARSHDFSSAAVAVVSGDSSTAPVVNIWFFGSSTFTYWTRLAHDVHAACAELKPGYVYLHHCTRDR